MKKLTVIATGVVVAGAAIVGATTLDRGKKPVEKIKEVPVIIDRAAYKNVGRYGGWKVVGEEMRKMKAEGYTKGTIIVPTRTGGTETMEVDLTALDI